MSVQLRVVQVGYPTSFSKEQVDKLFEECTHLRQSPKPDTSIVDFVMHNQIRRKQQEIDQGAYAMPIPGYEGAFVYLAKSDKKNKFKLTKSKPRGDITQCGRPKKTEDQHHPQDKSSTNLTV